MKDPTEPIALPRDDLARLVAAVDATGKSLLREWRRYLSHSPYARDAANLAAYIGFRRQDLRALQDRLSALGLSSLGRCEAHVLATLEAVTLALAALAGEPPRARDMRRVADAARHGSQRLKRNTTRLLGPSPRRRSTRIMVTLPTSAAGDGLLLRNLVQRGMDIARINCAHDDPAAWQAMIDNVQAAARAARRPCRIYMDLAGPKLRTGELRTESTGLHLKPKRDSSGRLKTPAYFLFDGSGEPGGRGQREAGGLLRHPRVAVDRAWLQRLLPGDRVEVVDRRGRRRTVEILERVGSHHVLASAIAGMLLDAGCVLRHLPAHGKPGGAAGRTTVGPFEITPVAIEVHVGDTLLLARDPSPGGPGAPPGLEPDDARLAGFVPCAQPEVLDDLGIGDRVYIDDGRIEARVTRLDPYGAWLEITRAAVEGDKVRAGRGLNFPDSALTLPALTDKDLQDLDFVVQHADMVGMSFVQNTADMDSLNDALAARGAPTLGRIAKIETRNAVVNLPGIIVAGASRAPFGLMIARGDLAVEIGWARLAEIQEEILWLAEAAHVPVIWATQVFEQLIKERLPSRAEMTDAAMSQRAECVMLNKGPFVLDAITLLDDLAVRMHAHQRKKTPYLRALHW
jgi:pyruvate kinase